MKVRDMMTAKLVTCSSDDTLAATAKKMQDNDIGCCPVVERDKLIGLVTDRDMAVRAIAKGMDSNSTMVSEVMSTSLIMGEPDMSAEDACELMAEHQIRRLPVVEGNRLVGMVSLADLAIDLEEEEMLADVVTRISVPSH
jgi:CBS domain-containing protein